MFRRLAIPLVGMLLPSFAYADSAGDNGASTPKKLAQEFIQYGLAFTGEFVFAAGPICSVPSSCIFQSGGGLGVRLGVRLRSPFYFGGAYEFSKQEPAQLYRLAILQQLRAEGRYYFVNGTITEPYLYASAGGALYGDAWGAGTGGPTFGLGAGVEFQLSNSIVAGVSLTYRNMYFVGFTDPSRTTRPAGFSHLMGLELIIEARDLL